MKEKICVIAAYFGKLPNYFPLWLKSCEKNVNIDFLLVTDSKVEKLPQNVSVYLTELSEIRDKASNILGFNVSLNRPYKLCDYKPMYGLLFKEYLKDYDYWGHCDLDLIFGDLEAFLNKYDFSTYDRFLPLGHLSFYRNSEEVNNRFKSEKLSPGFMEVFANERSFIFDEMPGMTSFYYDNYKQSFFYKRIFADIASVYKRYRLIEDYVYDVKPHNYNYQIFYWESGKCYREWFYKGQLKREEYIYIHFKKRPDFSPSFNYDKVNCFYITNSGFYEKMGTTTMADIKQYNRFPGKLYEIYELIKAKSKTYYKLIINKI